MSIELSRGDNLKCPLCEFEFDEAVEDRRIKEDLGVEGADTEQCPECGGTFVIIEYEEGEYSVEEAEDDDEDFGYEEEDD